MAATQWPQQYQQYQQQPQQYQQPQQCYQGQINGEGQHYQQHPQYQYNQQYQAQQYQHNQQYQTQPYQQFQHSQPTQQYQQASNAQSAQQYQQQWPSQKYQQQPQGHFVQQDPQNRQNQPQQGQSRQDYQQPHHGSSTQQYSQQQSHQLQQGTHGFQHQFTSPQHQFQQYIPQQHGPAPQHGSPVHPSPQQSVTPQPYGSSQHGAYQPQHKTAHGQSTAQTQPHPCFNCGISGHFAMNCPEPIREVPAGKANPQAFQNPLRRPKTGVSVATHHQYTAHPGHTQVSPNGNPPPPHGQTGYAQHPQYQQSCSPTTPISAQSPAQAQYYQQWQQYYQSQQAYQQGNHRQGPSSHQQPFTAPHVQAAKNPSSSQTLSQVSSQTAQYTGDPQMYQSRFTPASATPVQFPHPSASNKTVVQQDSRERFSTSMNPHSTPSTPHQNQALDYDFEEDDLGSLDVPDMPQTTLEFSNASKHPVSLIGHPLPGNFVVADALEPFPPPLPQDEGCCKSKYQYDASSDAYLANIRDSKHWDKDHSSDVAFSEFGDDGKIIPLDEVRLTIRQRHAHPELGDELNRESRSQSRTFSTNQDSLEVKMTLDRMERQLAETKAKLQAKLDKGRPANSRRASSLISAKLEVSPLQDPEIKEEHQTPSQSSTLEKSLKFEQDAEDVLAALGVTGSPKPVTSTTWPDQYSAQSSPNDMYVKRSRSSSRADIISGDNHQIQSTSGHGSLKHRVNGASSSKHHFEPPPPPPLLLRQQSCPDEKEGSSLSTRIAPVGHNTNHVDRSNGNGNGYISPSTDGQAASPIEPRIEKSLNRKRHRDESSDEEETAKRRQEDDYTPKLRKWQPKVAPAFGRRW